MSELAWSVLHGEALRTLRQLPDESVQCVVTSPPYWGLRDYGTGQWEGGEASCKHRGEPKPRQDTSGSSGPEKGRFAKTRGTQDSKAAYSVPVRAACRCGARRVDQQLGLEATPELYIEHMVEVFREVRRVLRKDGTAWVNLGDCYITAPHGACSTHDPKAPRSRNRGEGWGANRASGTGLKPKDLVGMPWRVALALQADGWYLRRDIIWHKPNPMPESAGDRCTTAHEYLFHLSKSERYYYDAEAIAEPVTGRAHPRGNGLNPKANLPVGWDTSEGSHHEKRGRYTRKQNASFSKAVAGVYTSGNRARKFRQDFGGPEANRSRQAHSVPWTDESGTRNRRSVWSIATEPFAGAHFATFPQALVEPCILAGSSAKACGVCGAPWARQVERERTVDGEPCALPAARGTSISEPSSAQGIGHGRIETRSRHLGWEPTCRHRDDTGRCIVLDPFTGSGTVGVVALRYGRRFLGIELSEQYAAMARERIAGPLFAAHGGA